MLVTFNHMIDEHQRKKKKKKKGINIFFVAFLCLSEHFGILSQLRHFFFFENFCERKAQNACVQSEQDMSTNMLCQTVTQATAIFLSIFLFFYSILPMLFVIWCAAWHGGHSSVGAACGRTSGHHQQVSAATGGCHNTILYIMDYSNLNYHLICAIKMQ